MRGFAPRCAGAGARGCEVKGTYVMPAIPPYCREVRTPVEVIEWRGDRVLLLDLEMQAKGRCYQIETDLGSFQPDIPPIEGGAK